MSVTRQLGPDERDLEPDDDHERLMMIVEERRDPKTDPEAGDRFMLNRRLVEIFYVNHNHTVRPEVSYRFMNWKRWDGGRAQYELSLESFRKKFAAAEFVSTKATRDREKDAKRRAAKRSQP